MRGIDAGHKPESNIPGVKMSFVTSAAKAAGGIKLRQVSTLGESCLPFNTNAGKTLQATMAANVVPKMITNSVQLILSLHFVFRKFKS